MEGDRLDFLQVKMLSPVFVLELIESILSNNTKLLRNHPEQLHVLRVRLMPLVVRQLSEKHGFPQTVRVARILMLLLRNYMPILASESEMALGLLIHLTEPESSVPWKRALCMEMFRGLYAEPGLIRLVYSLYDDVEGRRDIVKDHMASLVRIASERPSLIGISHQSTVPSTTAHSRSKTEEQIALEVSSVADMIGTPVSASDDSVTGISAKWSTIRTPYLELLDKSAAPSPPDTYIYNLVLNCISALSEGLAKFILPLTVPESKSKRKQRNAKAKQPSSGGDSSELQRSDSGSSASDSRRESVPLNPLELQNHPHSKNIKACAGIIDSCWPAVLATCSNFLYAALDDDYYHNLVRSFQKLTHVAGLLRQSTARDAFLTTLGKASMPTDGTGARFAYTNGQEDTVGSPVQGTEKSPMSPVDTPKVSSETSRASLSVRNLLCLRALLNLGIALGPTLDQSAWSIILQTLQNAELVIRAVTVVTPRRPNQVGGEEGSIQAESDTSKSNLAVEVTAVHAAASKLFDSTMEYPDTSFETILEALLSLSVDLERVSPEESLSPSQSPKPHRKGRVHRATWSATGKPKLHDNELNFVLDKTYELAKKNVERLSNVNTENNAWDILDVGLTSIIVHGEVNSTLRLKASRILNGIIYETMAFAVEDGALRNRLQVRNLQSLQSQISFLPATQSSASTSSAVEFDAHEQALNTLKSILERYGESFMDGWSIVFGLISTVFDERPSSDDGRVLHEPRQLSHKLTGKSPRLIRAAYSSLQLIASDFLPLLPPACLLELVKSFFNFASQVQEFNISLTATALFWNVSDYLQGQLETLIIDESIDSTLSEESLSVLVRDASGSVSRGALWLLLLLRIVDLTTDDRAEIRNSAIRTLLRVLDAYGPRLSSRAWHLCLHRVLFVMVDGVQSNTLRAVSGDKTSDAARSWVETAVVMSGGTSQLIANYFDSVVQDQSFDEFWRRLLDSFRSLLQVEIYEITEAIFSSLSDILSRVSSTAPLSKEAVSAAWQLWVDGHPALKMESLDLEKSNQDALLSYFRAYQQIYKLFREDFSEGHIEQILQHMRAAIWNSVSSRYSVDIEHQSTLQELISECLRSLCLDMESSQPAILLCLADFADAALTQWSADRDKTRPSYVAFSKRSIELVSWYITEVGIKMDIFNNGSLTTVLEHLANPVVQKYNWGGKDREPAIWKKATTASIDILRVCVPYVESQYAESAQGSEVERFWRCVVDIARGIVSATNCRELGIPTTTIQADEEFDVSAFRTLKSLIIPALGSAPVPDQLRRDFACALLRWSLIYPPQPRTEPSIEAFEKDPLGNLWKVRRGRTFEPAATARPAMAYVLIDTMFDLSSRAEGASNNDPRIVLARCILPYLILRAALPLKAYIADQPLRGLMPQPTIARRELLHIINRLIELDSEPTAVPDLPLPPTCTAIVPSTTDTHEQQQQQHHRRHLEWMYPLVVKAVQVAGKEHQRDDGSVLDALVRMLHVMEGRSEDGD